MRELFDRLRREGASALRGLVGHEEAIDLDCKLKRDATKPDLDRDDKANLGKGLSAFANSQGGLLLWGVDARRDPTDGLDRIAGFVPIAALDRFRENLKQLSDEALMPRLTSVAIEAIADIAETDKGFVAMYAERSERRPHRCELIEKGYFRRSGSSSRLMEHFEIEDAFKRATVADLELEHSITSLGVRAGGQGALIGIKLNLSNRSGASARFPYLMFRASGWKTKQS